MVNAAFRGEQATLILNAQKQDYYKWFRADDPVSDLVVKSHEPAQTHTKSAQSDPKRKANT